MDGFAFLEAYQQLPLARQRAIVIVMLTTSLHPTDVWRANLLPVAGFLTKPLTAEKVAQVLADHFPGGTAVSNCIGSGMPQPERADHPARSLHSRATPQRAASSEPRPPAPPPPHFLFLSCWHHLRPLLL